MFPYHVLCLSMTFLILTLWPHETTKISTGWSASPQLPSVCAKLGFSASSLSPNEQIPSEKKQLQMINSPLHCFPLSKNLAALILVVLAVLGFKHVCLFCHFIWLCQLFSVGMLVCYKPFHHIHHCLSLVIWSHPTLWKIILKILSDSMPN